MRAFVGVALPGPNRHNVETWPYQESLDVAFEEWGGDFKGPEDLKSFQWTLTKSGRHELDRRCLVKIVS